jgi:hypothetical protein
VSAQPQSQSPKRAQCVGCRRLVRCKHHKLFIRSCEDVLLVLAAAHRIDASDQHWPAAISLGFPANDSSRLFNGRKSLRRHIQQSEHKSLARRMSLDNRCFRWSSHSPCKAQCSRTMSRREWKHPKAGGYSTPGEDLSRSFQASPTTTRKHS